jgi:hypothetical protein
LYVSVFPATSVCGEDKPTEERLGDSYVPTPPVTVKLSDGKEREEVLGLTGPHLLSHPE